MSIDIFISYSHDDTEMMRRLRRDLQRVGFRVWTDEGITPGTRSWKQEIEKAIRECRCVIVLFSPASAQSQWVRMEIDFAETQRKPMFPLLVRGSEAESLPFGFAGYQHVDLRNPSQYLPGVNRLIAGVTQYLDSNNLTRPNPNLSAKLGEQVTEGNEGVPAVDTGLNAAMTLLARVVPQDVPRQMSLPLAVAFTVAGVAATWLILLLAGSL